MFDLKREKMLNNSGHCHLTLLHSIPCRKLHVIHKQHFKPLGIRTTDLSRWLFPTAHNGGHLGHVAGDVWWGEHVLHSRHHTTGIQAAHSVQCTPDFSIYVWFNGFDKRIFAVLWIQIPWIRIQNFGPIWIRVHRYVINFEEEKFVYRRTICL